MASEDGASVLATETPPPDLKVDVYTLDGFACSIVVKSTLTVWVLKALLKRRLLIPKREMMLAFGSEILSLPDVNLGDAFGMMEGTVDITLVRTPAKCTYCGSPGMKRCVGCTTYYCGRRCQRLDWSRHRDHCSAARTKAADLRPVDDPCVMLAE